MRRATILLATLILPLATAPGHAKERVFVGANLGASSYISKDGQPVTVLGWLRGAEGVGHLFGPGLRLGFGLNEGNAQSLYVDTGLSTWRESGGNLTSIQLMGAYQACFSSGPLQPYVTGGAGFMFLSDGDETTSSPVAGLGVGVRHVLPAGAGALRAELRYDYQFEVRNHPGELVVPALHVVGLKLGFDLNL